MPGGFETERKLYVDSSDLLSSTIERPFSPFQISASETEPKSRIYETERFNLTTEISYDRSKTWQKKLRLNLISPKINEISESKWTYSNIFMYFDVK